MSGWNLPVVGSNVGGLLGSGNVTLKAKVSSHCCKVSLAGLLVAGSLTSLSMLPFFQLLNSICSVGISLLMRVSKVRCRTCKALSCRFEGRLVCVAKMLLSPCKRV